MQITERKPNNDDEREASFESKYMIQTGNYVKFGTQLDTIFRNVNVKKSAYGQSTNQARTTTTTSNTTTTTRASKNDAFYEIINKKPSSSSSLSKKSIDGVRAAAAEPSEQLLHEEDKLSMWIDSKDLYCSCPKIRLRRKYLVMGRASSLLKYTNRKSMSGDDDEMEDVDEEEAETNEGGEESDVNESVGALVDEDDIQFSYDDRTNSTNRATKRMNVRRRMATTTTTSPLLSNRVAGLLVDRETSIIEWRPNYARRLRRFIRYYQSGKCS